MNPEKKLNYWRKDQLLDKVGNDYVVINFVGKRKVGLEAALAKVKKWNPMDGVGISKKNSNIIAPAICIDEFHEMAFNSYKRNINLCYLVILLGFLSQLVIGVLKNHHRLDGLVIVLMFFLNVIFEDKFYLKNKIYLIEKSKYFFWLLRNKTIKDSCLLVLCLLIILYTTQLILEFFCGGQDAIFLNYGFFYTKIDGGEYWRFITGPWFHASFVHFLGNASFMLVITPFVYFYCRSKTFWYFFFGMMIGEFFQWKISPFSDVLVGISGGVYALFGAALAITIRYRQVMPKAIWWMASMLGLFPFLLSHIFTSNAANFAHISGYIFGFIATFFTLKKQIEHA